MRWRSSQRTCRGSIRGNMADKDASCRGPFRQAADSRRARHSLVGTESIVCYVSHDRTQYITLPSVPSKREQQNSSVRTKMHQSSVRESVSHIKVRLFTRRKSCPFLSDKRKKQKKENKKKLSQPAAKAARKRPRWREWTHERRSRRIFELDFPAGGA